MQQPNDAPIVIAGAGIGGLTAAIALRKSGYDVQVLERAPALAEVGAGITLWFNALSALRSLGVDEAVRGVGKPSLGGVIALSSGRVLVRTSSDDLAGLGELAELRACHRAELQQVLYEQLPAGVVRFGTAVTGYELRADGVDVKLGDGSAVHAGLLVGADGWKSAVRAQLTGDGEPRYAGYVCWRGVCPIPSGWGGTCGEIWGVGDRFGVIELPGDRLYWFAVATAPAGTPWEPSDAGKAALCERFADYAFDVPKILEATPAEAIVFRDIADRPPRQGWSDGAVTLLGDAAHPTTPNMGQGAAMAMESAVILARALLEAEDVPGALATYEATRRPRTTSITNTSWTIGKMAHWENGAARWMRNLMFTRTPHSVREQQIRKLTSYDAGSAPLAT